MLKRHAFWLWLAVGFLVLNGTVHSIGLFVKPTPANEIERQLFDLMMNYRKNMGAGFYRSLWNLFTALSSCFTFLCFLAALTIGYLLKMKVPPVILKGVVGINLLVFGVCFIVLIALTFLLPIVLMGLVVLSLTIGFLVIPRAGVTLNETAPES